MKRILGKQLIQSNSKDKYRGIQNVVQKMIGKLKIYRKILKYTHMRKKEGSIRRWHMSWTWMDGWDSGQAKMEKQNFKWRQHREEKDKWMESGLPDSRFM